MDRRLHRSAPREEERLHRFLRPGALARLRDSRIVARSLRSAAAAATRLLPTSLPPALPSPPLVSEQQSGTPHFLGPVRGLGGAGRYPLRRRLCAARSVVFLPPSSPPAAEAFLGAFPPPPPPPDLVAARALS
ncbi:hypothetical protein E2562_036365 [Oryza meyeriana var. granulata]|uniref:Uncharacterized protein n=1 Tax=Oryza meyeriana var. granulata TaxID=110450 RepID=A0A6G1FG91_9ORYZ|nr:hypothetical protein E2562_036365 [Oryza meyeriana var. granulata]